MRVAPAQGFLTSKSDLRQWDYEIEMTLKCECIVCGSEKVCFVFTNTVVVCKKCMRKGIVEIKRKKERQHYQYYPVPPARWLTKSEMAAGN